MLELPMLFDGKTHRISALRTFCFYFCQFFTISNSVSSSNGLLSPTVIFLKRTFTSKFLILIILRNNILYLTDLTECAYLKNPLRQISCRACGVTLSLLEHQTNSSVCWKIELSLDVFYIKYNYGVLSRDACIGCLFMIENRIYHRPPL